MKKQRFFKMVLVSVCVAAAVILPSCKRKAPEKDSSNNGTMSITSEPTGATISIMGKDIGITPYDTNPVPSAMYIVKFSMDGYEPAWLPVNVAPGRRVEAHAALVPETATVVIDSEPTGAHLQLNGKEYDTPVVLSDLPLGFYSATLQMEGYTRRDISWKVQNSRPILINVQMMNNIGELTVSSNPDSADVEIDGKAYGTTPFNEFLEQGQHKIRLTKTGYKPYEKIVTVKRDDTTDVNVEMEMLPGSLSLNSEPSGAALFINGIDYGLTPYNRDSIEAGDYTIRLTKDGFDPLEQTITVLPGQPLKRSFILEPNTGTIVLSVNPPGLNIYLDDKFVCRTEPDSKAKSHDVAKRVTLVNISAGEHTLTVSNKHAEPKMKSITITIGKGKTVQVPDLYMWLPDTTIVLKNGSRYTGRLADKSSESSTKISFRPSAGITTEYNKSEIQEIIHLNIEDGE